MSDIPKFMNKEQNLEGQDSLDMPNFANSEIERNKILATTKVTYHNDKTISRVMKHCSNVGWKLLGIGSVIIAGALVKLTIDENHYHWITHPNDYYDDSFEGGMVHVHELSLKTFVEDYKIVNYGATPDDILKAINDDQYTDYIEHNGRIKRDDSLVKSPFSNDEIIEFAEDFIEEYDAKKHK